MTLTDKEVRAIANLALSATVGSGVGALAQYLIQNRVGWKGPVGGALLGSGGYLGFSPAGRAALLKLVGLGKPDKAGLKRRRPRPSASSGGGGKPSWDPLVDSAAFKKFFTKYTKDHHGMPPTAAEIHRAVPHMPVAWVKEIAEKTNNRYVSMRSSKAHAPGWLSNAGDAAGISMLLNPIIGAGMTSSNAAIAELAARTHLPPELLLAIWEGVDAAKSVGYNADTGKWSTDVLGNMRGTTESFVRDATGHSGSGLKSLPIRTARSTVNNIGSPVRSITSAGMLNLDTVGTDARTLHRDMTMARQTGKGYLKGILDYLKTAATGETDPVTDEQVAYAEAHPELGPWYNPKPSK